MAIGLNNLIRIKDFQTLNGQQVLNVYYYTAVELNGDVTYTELLEEFQDHVISQMVTVQADDVVHTFLEAENLTNGLDFETYTTGDTGTIAGSTLATNQLAWAIRLNRGNKSTRNGNKRIAGVAEGSLNNNQPEAATLVNLQTVADRMGSQLLIPDTLPPAKGYFQPVIVKSSTLSLAPGLQTYQAVVSGTALNRVTTQNSRKTF